MFEQTFYANFFHPSSFNLALIIKCYYIYIFLAILFLRKYPAASVSGPVSSWKISSMIHFLSIREREERKIRDIKDLSCEQDHSPRCPSIPRTKSKARSIRICGTLYLIAYNLICEITPIHASRLKTLQDLDVKSRRGEVIL